MAPKKKEKGKKNKGKGGVGSTIAAAVIPSAGFIATPRTSPTPPPAQNVPNLDLALSQNTGVLTSSMLSRMFKTPHGTAQRGTAVPGDLTAEDTDTSLYDYELGKGTAQPLEMVPLIIKWKNYSRIGSHLIPAVVFTAVPRVPPPPKESPKYSAGLSSTILNSTTLTRMFGTPAPPSESTSYQRNNSVTSDESSLNDYERSTGPSYRGNIASRKGQESSSAQKRHYESDSDKDEVGEYEQIPRQLPIRPERNARKSVNKTSPVTKPLEALTEEKVLPAETEIIDTLSVQSDDNRSDHSNQLTNDNTRSQATGYGNLRREAIPEHVPGSRLSYTDRERAPTPTGSENGSQRGTFYSALEDSGPQGRMVPEDVSALYSQPKKYREDSLQGSSSMRRFNDEDTATLRRSQRGRGSRRSRSSVRSTEERIESTIVNPVQTSAPRQSPLPRGNGRESPYNHAASPRLRTLRAQNEELVQKQLYLEQQLKDQQQQQQEMLDRLVQKGLLASQDEDTVSLLHQTQSMTDRSIRKQDELFKSLQARTEVVEEEKRELTELNEQLQAEIYSLKKMTSFREDGEGSSHENMLKKQLQELKEEASTLKATVHRTNVELSRYQAKFRPLKPHELNENLGIPGKGPKPSWLIDTKYLAPLFVSYDDRLNEKEDAVREAKDELQVIKQNIDEVIRENQRLHLRLEQTDVTGPVSMTEWRQLQEQCKLVLEENQLLMEQLDLQQNKAKDMHRAHIQEVTRISKQFTTVECEKKTMDVAFETLQHKMFQMQEKTGNSFVGSLDEQLTAISNLRSNLESEKNKHTQEMENTMTKIKMISAERKSLEVQLENIKSENKQLAGEVKALQKEQRKSHRKVLLLQAALSEAEVKEKSNEKYLKSVVRVAEKTVKERDLLYQSAEDKVREKDHAVSRLLEGSMTQQKMEEKLKMYKLRAAEKLEKAAQRMKDQDDDFNKQRHEYNREIQHLRNLLNEREQMLEGVVGDKKRVEEDLETMWQVASHDNRQMKETMKKSIRKLKEHEAFRHIEGGRDDDYLLTCTEDEHE